MAPQQILSMIPISPPISPLRSPEMALRWSIVLRDRGVRAPINLLA